MPEADERATATVDPVYNLVSVLYHALQAGETIDSYIQDAERHNDSELAEYLREVQRSDRQRADRAKALLKSRLG